MIQHIIHIDDWNKSKFKIIAREELQEDNEGKDNVFIYGAKAKLSFVCIDAFDDDECKNIVQKICAEIRHYKRVSPSTVTSIVLDAKMKKELRKLVANFFEKELEKSGKSEKKEESNEDE